MKAVPLLSLNNKNFTIMKKDIEFESEFERKKAEAERKAKFEKFCATYRNDMSECRKDFVSGYIDIVNY